jgi:Golgi apparatus protein 1
VHTCLRFNLKFLTERCAAEENKLAAVEFKDIRLRPKLAKVCSEERAVYCKVGGVACFFEQGWQAGSVGI